MEVYTVSSELGQVLHGVGGTQRWSRLEPEGVAAGISDRPKPKSELIILRRLISLERHD